MGHYENYRDHKSSRPHEHALQPQPLQSLANANQSHLIKNHSLANHLIWVLQNKPIRSERSAMLSDLISD